MSEPDDVRITDHDVEDGGRLEHPAYANLRREPTDIVINVPPAGVPYVGPRGEVEGLIVGIDEDGHPIVSPLANENADEPRLEIPVTNEADWQRAQELKARMQAEYDRRQKKRNSGWTKFKRRLYGLPGH